MIALAVVAAIRLRFGGVDIGRRGLERERRKLRAFQPVTLHKIGVCPDVLEIRDGVYAASGSNGRADQ